MRSSLQTAFTPVNIVVVKEQCCAIRDRQTRSLSIIYHSPLTQVTASTVTPAKHELDEVTPSVHKQGFCLVYHSRITQLLKRCCVPASLLPINGIKPGTQSASQPCADRFFPGNAAQLSSRCNANHYSIFHSPKS